MIRKAKLSVAGAAGIATDWLMELLNTGSLSGPVWPLEAPSRAQREALV